MRDFTVMEGHDDLIEQYKAQSDTIAEFLDTYFEPASDDVTVDTKVLYDAYEEFIGGTKGMVMTPQRFGRMLYSQPLVRFSKIKSIRNTKSRMWSGLKLSDNFEWNTEGTKVFIRSKNIINEDW
jgi:hypothetical protein